VDVTFYAWVSVGCLECGNPTVFKGLFRTLDEIKQAADDEVTVLRQDEVIDGPWYGSGVEVACLIEIPTVSAP
jgi:hypothetical protein